SKNPDKRNQNYINIQETNQGMVHIPGGDFIMGKDSDHEADFSPAHKVSVNSFYIDKHEVTNAEYYEFCQKTGHRLPEFWGNAIFRSGLDFPRHPVVGVSWSDAKEYAIWVGKRLPTEAEWEFAARGGLIDNEFPTGNEWIIPLRRNTLGEGWENLIVEVESYDSNAYGLFDISCNVWEWVWDKYNEEYYNISPYNNPTGPEKGTLRVIRGGSWHSGITCKKVYYRKGLPSNWVDFAVGFRCAKDR
ncbi:MAG: formylglycine-generating enzyme family protein, partial [Promethearchaeota archaeon]